MAVPSSDILDAFNFRFATKVYDQDKKITDKDFDLILETAQLTPSSFGIEPWDIIVVQDNELRKELSAAGAWGAKGTLPTASHFIIMTAKTGRALGTDSKRITSVLRDIKKSSQSDIDGMMSKYADWQRNDFSLGSPELLHQWAARQAYIALGNMMTVAAMRGIDSQPIEGFNIAKVSDVLEAHDLIDSANDLPVVMLSLGYRAMEQPKKTRRPIDQLVTWA